MPRQLPDFAAMSLPELRIWRAAIVAAIAAQKAAGGGGEIAILTDSECLSVILTLDLPEKPDA